MSADLVPAEAVRLAELESDAATPADAAPRLGTTVDDWLLSAAS